MVISVLIPTRGRPDNLRRAVDSLLDTATKPGDVELLFATDLDQPTAVSVVGDRGNIHELRSERRGYQRLHEYYNALCAVARGDLLALWNDDTEMLTTGWDDLLRDGPLFAVQNPRRDTVGTTDYTFPVMGRPIYEAMGHFALNPYNDAYVSHVAFYTKTAVIRDDIVFHHHCLTDAQVNEHGSDGIERFHSAEEVAMRQADMKRVVEAPGYESRFDGFDVEWRNYDFKLKYEYRTAPGVAQVDLVSQAVAAICTRKK